MVTTTKELFNERVLSENKPNRKKTFAQTWRHANESWKGTKQNTFCFWFSWLPSLAAPSVYCDDACGFVFVGLKLSNNFFFLFGFVGEEMAWFVFFSFSASPNLLTLKLKEERKVYWSLWRSKLKRKFLTVFGDVPWVTRARDDCCIYDNVIRYGLQGKVHTPLIRVRSSFP